MEVSRSSHTKVDITSKKLTPQNMPRLRDYISYMEEAISIEKTIKDPEEFLKKYIWAKTDAIVELHQVCDGITLLHYENPPSASDMTTLNIRSHSFLKNVDERSNNSARVFFAEIVNDLRP